MRKTAFFDQFKECLKELEDYPKEYVRFCVFFQFLEKMNAVNISEISSHSATVKNLAKRLKINSEIDLICLSYLLNKYVLVGVAPRDCAVSTIDSSSKYGLKAKLTSDSLEEKLADLTNKAYKVLNTRQEHTTESTLTKAAEGGTEGEAQAEPGVPAFATSANEVEKRKNPPYPPYEIVKLENYVNTNSVKIFNKVLTENELENPFRFNGLSFDDYLRVEKDIPFEALSPNDKTIIIALMWNKVAAQLDLQKIKIPLTEKRQINIKKYLCHIVSLDDWVLAIEEIQTDDFNLGVNDRLWKADFDWFIRPTSQNCIKLYEKASSKLNRGY